MLNAEVASSKTGKLPRPPGSLCGRTCGGSREISSGVTDMPPVCGWTLLPGSTGMSVPGRTPSWFAAEPHGGRPLGPLSIARNTRSGVAILGSPTSVSLSRARMLVHPCCPLLSRIAVQKAIAEILSQIRGDSQLCCMRRHYELLVRNNVTTGINAEFAPLGLDSLYRRRKDADAQEPS